MSRSSLLAVLLVVLLAVALVACDDGDSDGASKPRKSTTTSSSTTTTTVPSTSSTASTVPPATVPPPNANGACGGQTEAIVAAIGTAETNELVQQGGYTVQQCRLAASSPIWAAAEVVPKPGVMLDQATVVLQRVGALWNVMDIGTSGVGCTDTPADIRTELALVC